MADTPYNPSSGAQHPALDDFVSNTPDTAQDWAGVVAQQLQQHITGQALAHTAQQASDALVSNTAAFKDGAVDYVRKDPTALDTVLDMVPHTVAGIASGHADEGERTEASSALTAHIQGEAVKAAVQSYADISRGAARATLDKYGHLISPEDHGALSSYIDNMAMMRQADYEGQRRNELQAIVTGSNRAATDHLAELSHPDTGQLTFPQDWGKRMMANPAILPADKAALLRSYASLQVNGDPVRPDPDVVSDLVQRTATPAHDPDHPSVAEIVGHAGHGLSAQDASWLAARTGPQTPAAGAENQALSDTMQAARSQIGNKAAYGRFVSWFLPAYQRASATGAPWQDSLSPESKGYVLAPERLARFMPTGGDAISAIPRAGPRPSLGQIFAAARPDASGSVFDQIAGPRRPGLPSPAPRPMFYGPPPAKPTPKDNA